MGSRDYMLLDYNVLLSLLPFLRNPDERSWYKQQDMMSLMRTCTTMYMSGMPIYLDTRISATDYPDSASLIHFCDFFLNHTERIKYLRYLVLDILLLSRNPQVAQRHSHLPGQAAQILKRAHNLKRLEISNSEHLLRCHKDFSSAISSLENVRQLTLGWADENVVKVVASMRSPISQLGLFVTSAIDPIVNLAHLQDHLQQLHLSSPFRLNPRAQVQYPNMVALCIESSSQYEGQDRAELWELVQWFPNLKCLQLFVHEKESNIDALERARHMNQRELSIRGVKSWKHLDKLDCTVTLAYSFGLTCTLHRWYGGTLTSQGIPLFHTLLACFCPSYFQITVLMGYIEVEDFDGLLPPCTATHIHLNLNLRLMGITVADLAAKLALWISRMEHINVLLVDFNIRSGPSPTLQATKCMDFASYLEQDLSKVAPPSLRQVVLARFAKPVPAPPNETENDWTQFWEMSLPSPSRVPVVRSLTLEEGRDITEDLFPVWWVAAS